MGNHGDRSRNRNYSSSKNDEFEQLDNKSIKGFVQKIIEAIDEMLIRGKIPSSKLLNFLCELAEGKFITNEKLQEIESRINKIKELQERIKMLEEEVQSVKTLHNNVEVKLAEMSAQKEKFEHQYIETKKKLDERSKKLDSSSINNIVTFE